MVSDPIYREWETVSTDVTGNRLRENHLSSFCPPTSTSRGNKRVRFNEHIEMHFVPYEDRTSEWMHRSAD